MYFQKLVEIVVHAGIREPIQLLLVSRRFPAALVLTYTGINTMAFLNLPEERSDVLRSDFIQWSERYLHLNTVERIAGQHLYAARCSALHGGAPSRLARSLNHDPMSAVTAEDLATSFFTAIEVFFADVRTSGVRPRIVQQRLEQLAAAMPYEGIAGQSGSSIGL